MFGVRGKEILYRFNRWKHFSLASTTIELTWQKRATQPNPPPSMKRINDSPPK
jgi:hypothetical protein